ncbi:MAG: SseB family protein [Lachnospiraceae bacterium]|nr:SseB family protein [Lachnospiraceae bacterium]
MIDKKKLNDAMKGKKTPTQPTDPNMTLEVQNPEVEELMKNYAQEKTPEHLNQLIEKLRLSRMLVPANLNDKKQPVPCLIKSPTGELFLPIYTSKQQIPKEPKSAAVINMPFLVLNKLAAKPENKAAGIVINPFSDNLLFKAPLVQKIEEVEAKRANAPKTKTMQLTPEQYVLFERRQFEFGFLPKRFFEQGMTMLEELCEKKEEYIDALFEESYQQKRMYPYLPEDFSVMVMNISEELLLVRVDFPNRDMGVPSCWRVYMAWNRDTDKGRYFTIEKTKENGVSLLGEIGKDWKHVDHGQSPVEGAELQRVLDLIHDAETNC